MRAEIDFLEGLTSEFIATQRFKNAFKRLWGTTTVDGVEVFKKKFQIYKGTQDAHVQEFLGLIEAKDQVNGTKFKGVTKVWFEIDPDKLDGGYYDKIRSEILEQKIDNLFTLGTEYTVSANTTVDSINDPDWLGMTAAERTTYVEQNFDDVFNPSEKVYLWLTDKKVRLANRPVEISGDVELDGDEDAFDNEIHALSKYVLQVKAENFEITLKDVSIQAIPRVRTTYTGWGGRTSVEQNYFEYHIACEYTIKRTSTTSEDDPLVTAITDEQDAIEQQKIADALDYGRDTSGILFRSTTTGTTNELFYKGYFRASLADNTNMKSILFMETVLKGLKTKYKKKKVKWYKKVIALVVVILVIYFSSGTLTKESIVAYGAFVAVSTFFTTVAVSLAVLSAVLAQMGYIGIATYTSKFTKAFNFAATVTGIMAIINSIGQMLVKEATKRVATEAATKAGTDVLTETLVMEATGEITSVTLADIGNVLLTKVKSTFVGNLTSFNGMLGKLNMIAGMYMKNELAEIQNANNDLQKKIAEQEEELFINNEETYPFSVTSSPEFSKNLYQPLDRIQQKYDQIDNQYGDGTHNIAKRIV